MISNVKIETLELFTHADSRVAIIVANGRAGFNDVLHVFLTNDALAAWLKQHRAEHPEVDFKYLEDYLGTAVNFAIWNDVEGLSLHSVTDASFDVTRQDLTQLSDIFDAFGIMTSLKKGRTSLAEASDILKHKIIYFIGNKPTEGPMEKKDMVFGKTILGNTALAFLTQESAVAFAGIDAKVPINSCKLGDFSAMLNHQHPVRLEPDRTFSIEFPAEALIR